MKAESCYVPLALTDVVASPLHWPGADGIDMGNKGSRKTRTPEIPQSLTEEAKRFLESCLQEDYQKVRCIRAKHTKCSHIPSCDRTKL